MELTLASKAKIVGGTLNLLSEAYKNRIEKRVEEFLRFVDLRYESMSVNDQKELNEYIRSEAGQEILADFANTITQTSSRRVRMAIALVYCEDKEFSFDKSEKITFISAMKEIDDDLMNFFLLASQLTCQKDGLPYPRAGIHNNNYKEFSEHGWDEEAIFVYVNDLIKLRLLLPDPKSYSTAAGSGDGWAVWFGVTARSLKMANLLRKAEALLEEN